MPAQIFCCTRLEISERRWRLSNPFSNDRWWRLKLTKEFERVSIEGRNDGSRVLVIQDFPPVQLEPMTALLGRFGYDVLTAFEGETGLKAASDQHPDLIISDIATPDMSASELCRKLRADPKIGGTPVLLVSGLRRDSDPVLSAFRAGASDYLKMPYEPM